MTELYAPFDEELRERDPRFLRVVETDSDAGQGVYELRAMSGVGRAPFTFDPFGRVQTPNFDEATKLRLATTTAAPNPYTAPLKALHDATATPESHFEKEFKAARRRDLGLEEE
jgi:hypothetical protein